MTVFIDRSNVNGTDDYSKAPVTDLYLKVSEGSTFVDSTYRTRRAQAKTAGATVGGYHFAGHSDPRAEADFFLSKLVTPVAGDLRPCLDLESGQSVAWAEQFVSRIHKRLGYWPVLYGSTSFIAPMRARSRILRRCPWWRAEFGTNDGQHHALVGGDQGAKAHQYTSTASVPGISGQTDRSVFLDRKAMLVPAAERKAFVVLRDGEHVKNFRTRAGVHLWMARHRQPRKGHQIQIRHRKQQP